MIIKILKCVFILHQVTISTCCLCRDPGLVHPLLGEIHTTVSDRITKGFDKGDLDLYMEVRIHMWTTPCQSKGVFVDIYIMNLINLALYDLVCGC